ncbi:MAG: hypothetical protein AAGF85_22155, partial [Bacteroidota bacterium]
MKLIRIRFFVGLALLLTISLDCQSQSDIKNVEKLFGIIAESDSTNINGLLETIIIADSLMQVNDG